MKLPYLDGDNVETLRQYAAFVAALLILSFGAIIVYALALAVWRAR